MRHLILAAMLLCLPVRGEAWQVVGEVAGVSGPPVSDNFSTDTIDNYTNISGTLSISGEAAHGSAWEKTVAYHEAPTGSNDHYVSATCEISSGGVDNSCVIVGSNGTQYYQALFAGGSFYIYPNSGDVIASYNGSYAAGTHSVVVQIDTDGSNRARFNAWIDGTKRITDALDYSGQVTRGPYVGVIINRTNASTDVVVDNLVGNAGAYTP